MNKNIMLIKICKKDDLFFIQFQKSFYKLDKKETAASSEIKGRTYSCLFCIVNI